VFDRSSANLGFAKQLAEDPATIAKFLLYTQGLDDAALGDYVGDGDEMCSQVLKCLVSTFNFRGLGFDDALRKFLSAFRLPGEAQKIERIMDAFSAQFYGNNPSSFRHSDTAFKLAYSVIMLNTDAHNPAIKASRKMTKEQFVRNNRGLDDDHDLPQEFLETIHDRIVANEIKMQPYKNDAGDKSILAYTNPHKQGWLKKESGRFKAWNERWFLLKDSCLYYLRKPPVWGADCELCGHIPLHTSLVARTTKDSEQPSFVLEMSNGSMLKTGKIEKRASVMKTTQVAQLRLLASSQNEAHEWVSAINNNVKALNDARNGLPAPEWTRPTASSAHVISSSTALPFAPAMQNKMNSLPVHATAGNLPSTSLSPQPQVCGASCQKLSALRPKAGSAFVLLPSSLAPSPAPNRRAPVLRSAMTHKDSATHQDLRTYTPQTQVGSLPLHPNIQCISGSIGTDGSNGSCNAANKNATTVECSDTSAPPPASPPATAEETAIADTRALSHSTIEASGGPGGPGGEGEGGGGARSLSSDALHAASQEKFVAHSPPQIDSGAETRAPESAIWAGGGGAAVGGPSDVGARALSPPQAPCSGGASDSDAIISDVASGGVSDVVHGANAAGAAHASPAHTHSPALSPPSSASASSLLSPITSPLLMSVLDIRPSDSQRTGGSGEGGGIGGVGYVGEGIVGSAIDTAREQEVMEEREANLKETLRFLVHPVSPSPAPPHELCALLSLLPLFAPSPPCTLAFAATIWIS